MIKGRIARILSESEVLLNVGRQEGVKEGLELIVYSEGEHVTDPETGEDLGPVETVKGRLRVTHVQERMCRAVTHTYEVPSPSLVQLMSFDPFSRRTEARQYKLNVERAQVAGLREDLTVRVNDLVREA